MQVFAPVTGYQVQLDTVPDEVFSKRLVGDGISIDPTEGLLKSPVDGVVEFLHPAHHALTIKTASGAEVLIHIGLDTVKLKGEGFRPLVKLGDQLKIGQSLIQFDLDFIATSSKSLLTQMIVTNGDSFTLELTQHPQLVVAGKDSLFTLLPKTKNPQATTHATPKYPASSQLHGEQITCPNPSGLHARPAAVLSGEAKKYSANILLHKGTKSANAKSVVGIMSLEIGFGDLVSLSAEGTDAQEALVKLSKMLTEGLGEAVKTNTLFLQKVPSKNIEPLRQTSLNEFPGVSASPGLVIGQIKQLREQSFNFENGFGENPDDELKKLQDGIQKSKVTLGGLVQKLNAKDDKDKASIFTAHLEILEDPELYQNSVALIKEGRAATYAWHSSYTNFANQLAQLNNQVLAARAHDILDVGVRVLRHLTGDDAVAVSRHPDSKTSEILIAKILTPSDLVEFDNSNISAFCTVEGGPSSHVSILARSMSLPSATSFSEEVLSIPNGTLAILDTAKGLLRINPSPDEVDKIKSQQQSLLETLAMNLKAAKQTASTKDNHHVEVYANVGSPAEAKKAVTYGAEGVGLVRSEFLFLERSTPPNEDEQFNTYSSIAKELSGAPVVIRTLDVGGDKPLSYLPMASEENPFLGIRGLRLSLRSQDLFRLQLRALLKTHSIHPIRIMFPMVTSLHELLLAKQILQEEASQLQLTTLPQIGIMIEVPSAALLAENFAPHVDFFSIGSNDLTQYTLAIDRGHPQLSQEADGLHPAVLRLIQMTAEAAHKHQKFVGICGGMASDSEAVPFLIGLGLHELSASVPSIPSVKAQIRNLNFKACQDLARQALSCNNASEVRSLSKKFQEGIR